ncbi:MAG TPA: VanZ family protein [Noviherbaspirillum sp.]|jgi:VanZ family protein|uniref:VanZ family protein n=1 Tax=Noviherbaspirillum sp. TaxID=1926288 RepID=UPI002F92BFA5
MRMQPHDDSLQLDADTRVHHAQVSTFARVGLLAYSFLIIYASLYPFAQWQDIGLRMWGFLLLPLPHYWTGFDVVTNVVGYLPFGALVVFALYPTVRGGWAAAVALAAGMLLSGSLEALQTFLPNRVSSNLDFITNTAGAAAGALAGMLLTPFFLQQSRLLHVRRNWLVPEAGRGLIVLGLWPLAQIYPQGYLFGHGQLMPILSDWLSDWAGTPIDLAALLAPGLGLDIQDYWLAEILITALGMTGALLTMSCVLRKQAPTVLLVGTLAIAAIAAKALANAVLFTPANALAWLTPGARGGLAVGAMMMSGLAYAPAVARRRLAIASLLAGLAIINLVPANPYFVATLQAWTQGKFLNFNGAAHFLSVCWPFIALWFLLHPMHRRH